MKEKLLNKTKIINECWEWQGSVTNAGYGKIRSGNKHLATHRLSYELFKGEIPEGKLVCHSCDNKLCVNPDHLWLGSQKENIQDAKKKGILPKQFGRKHSEETLKKLKFRKRPDKRGEKHHLRKLKNDDVFKIRELLEQGLTQTEISKIYEVSSSVISNIKRKKSWSHI
jgi:HNH endonuclease